MSVLRLAAADKTAEAATAEQSSSKYRFGELQVMQSHRLLHVVDLLADAACLMDVARTFTAPFSAQHSQIDNLLAVKPICKHQRVISPCP